MAKNDKIAYVTPQGVARYAKISKPDTEGKYADGKYKTFLMFDDAGFAQFEKTLKDAAKQFFGAKVSLDEVKMPYKKFDDGTAVNFKSKYRPAVFDAKKKKLPDDVLVGSGSVIRIAGVIEPYEKQDKVRIKNADGKVEETTETIRGLTLRLNDVQVIKLSQGGAAGTGDAFDEVEGFSYEDEADEDMSTADSPFDL
jgi:hypothetical protein